MKHIIKKGEHEFSPKLRGWRLHAAITFAEWRGHFDESTWYEPEDGQAAFNQGGGWTFGRKDTNAILWVWRPVLQQGQKMQEIALVTAENGLRSTSKDSILLPLGEDFFVQLKTNGTFASLAARPFTGNWQMITNKWGARSKKGSWLGLALGDHHASPQDMTLELKRIAMA